RFSGGRSTPHAESLIPHKGVLKPGDTGIEVYHVGQQGEPYEQHVSIEDIESQVTSGGVQVSSDNQAIEFAEQVPLHQGTIELLDSLRGIGRAGHRLIDGV